MNTSSIKEYLRHYGRIRSLRGSVIRSTFKRVTAAFDDFNQAQVDAAIRELGLEPTRLTCVYCGKEAACWDHLIPAAHEGTHQLRNLAPACTNCNHRKGDKTWKDFFDTLDKANENIERRRALERYTKAYKPGDSLITDPVDQEKLAELLDRIHQAMSEADDVVAAAIARQRAGHR